MSHSESPWAVQLQWRVGRTLLGSRLHRSESGSLSIISLTAILAMLLAIATVGNVALTMRSKIDTQNTADAVAISVATRQARGMNAITAMNHLIGEIHAITALHSAVGGDSLDKGNVDDLRENRPLHDAVRETLSASVHLAFFYTKLCPRDQRPLCRHHRVVQHRIISGASIFASKLQLQKIMAHTYGVHAGAGIIRTIGLLLQSSGIPVVRETGQLIKVAGLATCRYCRQQAGYVAAEFELLNMIELRAKQLVRWKKVLMSTVIPAMYRYTQYQQYITPYIAENAGREVAERNLVEGAVFPGRVHFPSAPVLQLPVEPENKNLDSDKLGRSQLVRAAAPWVHRWRLPYLELGERGCKWSYFKEAFVWKSQEFTKKLADRAKRNNGVNLLVMKGLNKVSLIKGRESWRAKQGSREADRMFSVLGFTRSGRVRTEAARFFEPIGSQGIACYAQAMVYNRLPGTSRTLSTWQDAGGWDTLNWKTRMPELSHGKHPKREQGFAVSVDTFRKRAPNPQIALSWDTIMVPATRIREGVWFAPEDLGELLQKTAVESPISRTH